MKARGIAHLALESKAETNMYPIKPRKVTGLQHVESRRSLKDKTLQKLKADILKKQQEKIE